MPVTLRFRPILFGPAAAPTAISYLLEASDGRVYFRDFETAWPLEVSIEAARVEDLPRPYREQAAAARILPVHAVAAATRGEAFERMIAALGHLETGDAARRRSERRSA